MHSFKRLLSIVATPLQYTEPEAEGQLTKLPSSSTKTLEWTPIHQILRMSKFRKTYKSLLKAMSKIKLAEEPTVYDYHSTTPEAKYPCPLQKK